MYNVFATHVFEKDLKKLSKKYRRIRNDFSPILEQFEAGEFPGDVIQGFQDKLFKVRVPSPLGSGVLKKYLCCRFECKL